VSRVRKGRPISGWIILDKPLGMTSTQAVAAVRRLTQAAKAGHGGTLDPLASGVLPIALGEATKTVAYAMGAAKVYRFIVQWGSATSTDDKEGEIVATSDTRPTEAAIRALLPGFTGEIMQRPPAYSALKIDGRRAYDLARKGEDVVLEPRPIRIDRLELVEIIDENQALFEVACGKGAYIRSLARDFGERLGCHGHVAMLRREQVGKFRAERAFSLDSLSDLCQKGAASEYLLPIETALDDIPALVVTGPQAERLRHGQSIRVICTGLPLPPEGELLVKADGKPVGIGQRIADEVRPVRLFNHHDVAELKT
jgi:tRNA pseudouridine55 synthase